MSKQHEMERRIQTLGEISEIMGAMKNLSLMEIRKLTRYLSTQRRAVESLEWAAEDLMSFHHTILPVAENPRDVYLLIGSERGFCGDFNESLQDALEAYTGGNSSSDVALVTVGYKLATRLTKDPRLFAMLDGPSVVEEVDPVLTRLMETLNTLPQSHRPPPRPLHLTVFHHQNDTAGVQTTVLEPFKRLNRRSVPFSHPPLLNLPLSSFLSGLVDQYLFASLYELFYSSLMAENNRRFQHMEGAIRQIEEESAKLWLRRNSLRQEEITEEIEVIMLSAERLNPPRKLI